MTATADSEHCLHFCFCRTAAFIYSLTRPHYYLSLLLRDKAVLIMTQETTGILLRCDLNLPERLQTLVLENPSLACKTADATTMLRVRPTLKPMDRHQTAREYFECFDKDKSGAISLREMTRAFPRIGLDDPALRAEVAAHFRHMDRNGSGQISFAEFAASTVRPAPPATLADEQEAARFDDEM